MRHFRDAIDHVVHELAVVADHDNGALVGAQEPFQPLDAFQVKMVGRLVEHQDLGIAHQKLGQRDAHLPTPGEIGGRKRKIAFLEAEAEHDAAHLRLDGVAAERLVGIARAAGGGELPLGGVVAQGVLQLVQAALRLEDLHLRGHHFLEDGAIGHLDGLLLKVAHARALREQDTALIRVFAAADDVEHGGFAGAVRTDQRKPVVLLQAERDIGEQRAAAERLRDMLNLQDHA